MRLQGDLDRADELIENANWQEARQLLNSLLEKHPDETEVQERRRAVESEIQRIHSRTAALHYDAAVKLLNRVMLQVRKVVYTKFSRPAAIAPKPGRCSGKWRPDFRSR